ncbi:MAG: hypothetical protein ACXWJZ_04870 [Burkholderiaceae bacterium]
MTPRKSWTTIVEDVGDGSGDLLIKFPDEVMKILGWKPGAVLNLKVENGVLWITKSEKMKISLIVTGVNQLIRLALNNSLDTLLLPNVRVVIPDMVRFEIAKIIEDAGDTDVLGWIREHEFNQVFIGSTEIYEEFLLLREINPSIGTKNRSEQAAAEILGRELSRGVEGAILLFEDSVIKNQNLLGRLPDNVITTLTSALLNGIQREQLLASVDEILNSAVNERGETN